MQPPIPTTRGAMSELQRLRSLLELQDAALAECFEQLKQLDPEAELAVSPEWLAALSPDSPPAIAPMAWPARA